VKEEEDGYWLRYSGFDSLTEPTNVYELAIRLLGEIRGVAKLLGGGVLEVKVVGLAQENDAGPRPQYAFLEGIPSDERFGMDAATFTGMIAVAERNPGIVRRSAITKGGLVQSIQGVGDCRDGTNGRSNGWTSDKVRSRFTNTVNNPEAIGTMLAMASGPETRHRSRCR
jgi:hypothetical protein